MGRMMKTNLPDKQAPEPRASAATPAGTPCSAPEIAMAPAGASPRATSASVRAIPSTPAAAPAGSALDTGAPRPKAPAAPVRGRFAPTPSGRMHLGNVWCALMAWLAVRSQGGSLILRIEDLNPHRVPAGTEEALIDDLRWLGLDWDEGPIRQSERFALYAEHAARLTAASLTYPCFCSRADLHTAEAPHASDGTPIYAGTCRGLTPEQVAQRQASRPRPPALRLIVPSADDPAGTISFIDGTYGPVLEVLAHECGDFLIQRSDGVFAYQLAVTVDDVLMGVTQIVRGRDLLPSTARQIYLQRLLGFAPQPSYAHIPMLLAADGTRRLSKRDHDCDLGFMREHFGRPEVLLGRLAQLGGLRGSAEPTSARELLDGFSWEAWAAEPSHRQDIPVPSSFFC